MSIKRFMTFTNKTAIITGGCSEIGYHMVRLLCPYNKIIVIDSDGTELSRLYREFPEIEIYQLDLTNPHEYKGVADKIIRKHKHIDALIHNVSAKYTANFLDPDFNYEAIEIEIHMNFTSVCALNYLLLPALLQTDKEAVIAHINSEHALFPEAQSAVHCATKAGINMFTKSIRQQLKDTNIRVMQVFIPLLTKDNMNEITQQKKTQNIALKIILGIEQGVKTKNLAQTKIKRFKSWFKLN